MRLLSKILTVVRSELFFAVSVKLQARIQAARRIWAAMSWPSRFGDLSFCLLTHLLFKHESSTKLASYNVC